MLHAAKYLEAFPNLESLVLADCLFQTGAQSAGGTVPSAVLSRLRHLHLTFQRTDANALFKHLNFPKLESLVLEGTYGWCNVCSVSRILRESGCSGITTLAIRLDSALGSEPWADLLAETPYLERLRILIHYDVKSWHNIEGLSILDWNSMLPLRRTPRRLCPHINIIELDVYCHGATPRE